MKKLIKIIAILVLALVVLGLVLPFLFKGKIIEMAKSEINKSINATVTFSDIGFGLFRSFPDFSLSIDDLTITGKDIFENDTLSYVKKIKVTIGLMSVFSGDSYEIKKINIDDPYINILMLEDGRANYDIALPDYDTVSAEKATSSDTTATSFNLALKRLNINHAKIIYDDRSAGMLLTLTELNHDLSGNISESRAVLQTQTEIEAMSFVYDGVAWLKNAGISYKADIDADNAAGKYTLRENELRLNHLLLNFAGSLWLSGDDTGLDFTFEAPNTDFKNLLSLIPALYLKDFEDIKTEGQLALNGSVSGIYNENNLPGFQVNLGVSNASFGYPGLPGKVDKINMKASVVNPGGDADNTIVDVPEFSLEMNGNPVDVTFNLKTPVSDPDIAVGLKALIDLAGIKDVYPLPEDEEINGRIEADFSLQAKTSQFENEDYENIRASGFVRINDMKYRSSYVNDVVEIMDARMSFTPALLQLNNLEMKIGNSDLQALGNLSNYLAYGLSDGVLKGEIVLTSAFLDISALMPENTESADLPQEAETVSDSAVSYIVEIPADIDFTMSSGFRKLIYDGIEMENVKGQLEISGGKLLIRDVSMDILEGRMIMNGSYSSVNIEKPEVDFNLDMSGMDIQKSYNTFALVSKYAPIARKTSGKFNVRFNFRSVLDHEMMPVYESLNGEGRFSTSMIKISDVNTLDKAADFLKFEKIRSADIDKIMFDFKFVDGKVLVEPFDFEFENIAGKLGGWTAIDETIDYVMTLNIPRKDLGPAASGVVNGLASGLGKLGINYTPSETVGLNVLIGGILSDPQVKLSLKESAGNLVNDLQNKVKEEIEKKKEELTKEALERAQKIIDNAEIQANKLMAEAQKQADNIRNNAKSAADKLIAETDIQAKKVEDEGKKKGLIAAAAAKETAKRMREEAKTGADKLIKEGDAQANSVVNTARSEADSIRAKAKEEAAKITGGK
ncbi:MAG: hypothetical protein JXA03_00360 [Bacteroidales bacterium]|nr:hypothetical protein [Bacteroidales bacterium]